MDKCNHFFSICGRIGPIRPKKSCPDLFPEKLLPPLFAQFYYERAFFYNENKFEPGNFTIFVRN